MHIVVVACEGNHLPEMSEVLEKCGYMIERSKTVQSGKQASSEMAQSSGGEHIGKAAYFANGWTYVGDPELVLMGNDAWLHYSKKWKSRIVAWLCEGTSASYGLTVYESGKQRRQVVCVDGNVVVNKGKPLPEESKVDWGRADEKTLLQLAERVGAKKEFPAKADYTIFQLSAPRV
jgi:hypothetical protein